MATARAGHTATLLGGPACKTSSPPAYCGKVLVAGGTADNTSDPFSPPALPSSELYNPRSGGWAPTAGLLNTARSAHTATLLADGKVLVVGGRGNDGGELASVELYDPATGTWASCSTETASASCPAPLAGARYDHTATRLTDGRVLVAGGFPGFTAPAQGFSEPSAELFNPATGKWTKTATELMQPRYQHSATLLRSGKVLVTGGTLPPVFSGPEPDEAKVSSELFDPTSNTWSSCSFFKPPASPKPTTPDCPGDLGQSRYGHSATLLPDGKVVAAGGTTNSEVRKTADLYDPATGAWTPSKQLNVRRSGPGAVLLPNGKVLAAGGEGAGFNSGLASAELYDPATPGAKWNLAPFMSDARGSDFQGPHSVQTVLLSSEADAFKADPQVCGANCGKVLVVGGLDELLRMRLASAELYTPEAAESPGPQPPGGGGLTSSGTTSSMPPPSSTRDTMAPGVAGYGLTNNPFVVGKESTPTFGSTAAKKRHRKGTTFRYTLSEAASVRIVISQRASGRRKGRRCVAPTRKLRKATKCTRLSTRGTLTRMSRQGANSVDFSGRLGSRALKPGRYQATLTATDGAQNTSKPKTIPFAIVKR